MPRLEVGDTFPEMKIRTVGGGSMTIPADLEGEYAIVLFYRGWW